MYLNGNLTPTGDIATTAEVIDSEILGDATIPRPDVNSAGQTRPPSTIVAEAFQRPGSSAASAGGGSSFVAGDQYEYVFTFDAAPGRRRCRRPRPFRPSRSAANGNNITLSNLPASPLDGVGNPQLRPVEHLSPQTGGRHR